MVAVSWIGLIGMISDVGIGDSGKRRTTNVPPRRLNYTCCGWSSARRRFRAAPGGFADGCGQQCSPASSRGVAYAGGFVGTGLVLAAYTKASACPLWSRTMDQGVVSSGDGLPRPTCTKD